MTNKKQTSFTLNLLGIGIAVSLLGDATLYTVLPHVDIYSQLGITLSMVGLLLGANRAIRLLLNGPIGILFDRFPRRGLLTAGLSLGAASSIIYAVGNGFWLLLAGRISWGIAWGLLWIGGNTVVLDLSTEENRGRISGIFQMWFLIGVAATSFFGAMLTDMFGFRNTQWISSAIIAVFALAWFFFLPETKKDRLTQDDNEQETKTQSGFPWKVVGLSSIAIFIARFMAWGVLAATAILWLSGIFEDGLKIGSMLLPIATLTGLYTALSNLVSVGSTPLAGLLSDRLGRRWPVIGFAMVLGGVGLWLMSGDIRNLALMGAFLVPLASSSTETLIPAIVGDHIHKDLRSRALGLINTAGDLGATIGPFAALGILNAGWLSIHIIYKTGSGLYLLTAILMFLSVRLTGAGSSRQNNQSFSE